MGTKQRGGDTAGWRPIGLAFCLGALAWLHPAAGQETAAIDFERDVAPLLLRRCLECHHAADPAGGLSLARRESLLQGGDSGAAIVAGRAGESLLLERIRAGEMPPPHQGKPRPLPPPEVATLQTWIDEGAHWPDSRLLDPFERTNESRGGRDWWSWQPIARPSLPAAAAAEAAEADNVIDAFIQARLREQHLVAAPPADRATLVRRVYRDLIGLPPAREDIEAFVADDSPDAYERLVDRLLASPHFGERWGRYWLDVARFAETCGYERDQVKPEAWRYRDYVIRAWNADKPYDQFVVEQLAGDELPGRCEETVIATGFLMLGTWNDEPNDPQEYKYERMEDLVHSATTAFLAMTVKCARCHDHKFDPIPQADYYRLAAAFWPGPIEPRDARYLGGPSPEELGFPVLGWTDIREPPPLHLLKKGDPRHPGPLIEPGFLSAIPAWERPGEPASGGTSGRRLRLARWLVDPNHPLTARVLVNRLWQHHFGEGLVRSPNNFGFTGEQPTHPELLDWLSADLLRAGWRTKPLHRLMLLSRTYRQASLHPDYRACEQLDFANRWWWRAERRRLDAEALRDAMLLVSGQLDRRMGGPSFKPTISGEALEGLSKKAAAWEASPPAEQRRRSVYTFTQRSLLPPWMTTLDFPDTTLPCGQRDVTTVAPQALMLLNGTFAHDCSQALARRLDEQAVPDAAGRVQQVWGWALGRAARPEEVELARAHVQLQESRFRQAGEAEPPFLAWASLCHVVLNSNEFLYGD